MTIMTRRRYRCCYIINTSTVLVSASQAEEQIEKENEEKRKRGLLLHKCTPGELREGEKVNISIDQIGKGIVQVGEKDDGGGKLMGRGRGMRMKC